MNDLKPCPFCGCKSKKWEGINLFHCSNLSCELNKLQIKREEWNSRPNEDALRAEVSKLGNGIGDEILEVLKLQSKLDILQSAFDNSQVARVVDQAKYKSELDALQSKLDNIKAASIRMLNIMESSFVREDEISSGINELREALKKLENYS